MTPPRARPRAPGFPLALVLLAAFPSSPGCGSSGAAGAGAVATVEIPSFPFWPNAALVVDEVSIAALASEQCDAEGGTVSSAGFFLGDLPYASIDRICEGVGSRSTLAETLLGNLYVSGYFGGIWLRDALGEEGDVENGARATRSSPLDRIAFDALAGDAARRLDLARGGEPSQVVEAAHRAVPPLLAIFGYNLGYLEVTLDNPPDGAVPPGDLIDCPSFLGCTSGRVDLVALARYEPVLAKLEEPPTPEWTAMAAEVERSGVRSVAAGRAVWETILGERSLSPQAYGALLDLSAGYLLVTEAAVLASMSGWAEGEPRTARCAALLQAGLVVWSGSYFLGLASPAPPGTFPSLECVAS